MTHPILKFERLDNTFLHVIHLCDEQQERFHHTIRLTVADGLDPTFVIVDGDGGYQDDPISFCPYCGVNLLMSIFL